jgi:hypothetical protein
MAKATNPLTPHPMRSHQYHCIFPSLSDGFTRAAVRQMAFLLTTLVTWFLVATVRRYHRRKKTGVAEYPEVFDHAGILVNGPPGMAELSFTKSSDDRQKRITSLLLIVFEYTGSNR